MSAFRRLTRGGFVSAALLVSTGWAADPVWNVRDHIPLDRIAVQAHRGAGDLAPEGSLEAFELAWKLGCSRKRICGGPKTA